MTDDKSNEHLRELRHIRYTLYLIVLVLSLISAQLAVSRWAESHYSPRTSAIESR